MTFDVSVLIAYHGVASVAAATRTSTARGLFLNQTLLSNFSLLFLNN